MEGGALGPLLRGQCAGLALGTQWDSRRRRRGAGWEQGGACAGRGRGRGRSTVSGKEAEAVRLPPAHRLPASLPGRAAAPVRCCPARGRKCPLSAALAEEEEGKDAATPRLSWARCDVAALRFSAVCGREGLPIRDLEGGT